MFCGNCGAQNPDDARVCAMCGTPLETLETEAPAADAPEFSTFPETVQTAAAKKRNTAIGIGVVAAIALVVIIAIAAVVLTGKPAYVKTVEKYFSAVVKEDAKKLVSVLPPEYVEENLEDSFDDRQEMLEIMEENLADVVDGMEDQFGEKIKVKCKVRKDKELGTREVKNLKETYESYYDLDLDIKEARELKVRVTMSGTEDEDSANMEIIVMKIGGKWYLDVRNISAYAYY